MNKLIAFALGALLFCAPAAVAQNMIQKNNIQLSSDLMTPEALWAMGRLGQQHPRPMGNKWLIRSLTTV